MLQDDLLTVGEAFEDLIFFDLARLPGPGEEVKTSTFLRTFGGGAVITAIAAARLGLRCRVMSGLSAGAVARLRAEKVRVKNLRGREEPHAITAALSTRKNRSFVTFNGINDYLEARLLKPARRIMARHAHFAFYPSDCSRWKSVIAGLRRRRISTSWDFGWNEGLLDDSGLAPLLWALDYVFLNEQEALLYSRESDMAAAMRYWRTHAKNVLVKLGGMGCQWISQTFRLKARPPRVKVVDTTGAGDAFNGGFLFGIVSGMPPRECLRIANWVGALSTRMPGGIDGLPRRDELR